MDIKEKEKSLALKVEKSLKSMSQDFRDDEDGECEDSEHALITKVMKKFRKKSQPRSSSAPPNLAEIWC